MKILDLFSRNSRTNRSRSQRRRRSSSCFLRGEPLENRLLMTTLAVNNAHANCAAPGGIYCDIQEALDDAAVLVAQDPSDTITINVLGGGDSYLPIAIETDGLTI